MFRGVYSDMPSARHLPENWKFRMWLVQPGSPPTELEDLGWFPAVRDTQPLAKYDAVFDYKWIGWKASKDVRLNAMAMLFWEGLIVAAIFHDPACECGECHQEPVATSV